jgi:hypothetical protein
MVVVVCSIIYELVLLQPHSALGKSDVYHLKAAVLWREAHALMFTMGSMILTDSSCISRSSTSSSSNAHKQC